MSTKHDLWEEVNVARSEYGVARERYQKALRAVEDALLAEELEVGRDGNDARRMAQHVLNYVSDAPTRAEAFRLMARLRGR